MTATTGAMSCADCKYSGSPGIHWVEPEDASVQPYPVKCPVRAATEDQARLAKITADFKADESTAAFKAAKDIIRDAAHRYDVFSANTIRSETEQAQVPGPVVGAAFSWAARNGLIEMAGQERSTDAGTKGHHIFRWRSLVRGRRTA